MTDEQLAEIHARLEAAIQHDNWEALPIRHSYNDGTTYQWAVHCHAKDISGADMTIRVADWLTEDLAQWLASAPTDIKYLLDEVERLRGENNQLRDGGRVDCFSGEIVGP